MRLRLAGADVVTIDWSVNIGHVVTFVAALFAIATFYVTTRTDIKTLRQDSTDLKIELRAVRELITEVALQKQRLDAQGERLNRLDKLWDELRRGVGLIQEK